MGILLRTMKKYRFWDVSGIFWGFVNDIMKFIIMKSKSKNVCIIYIYIVIFITDYKCVCSCSSYFPGGPVEFPCMLFPSPLHPVIIQATQLPLGLSRAGPNHRHPTGCRLPHEKPDDSSVALNIGHPWLSAIPKSHA